MLVFSFNPARSIVWTAFFSAAHTPKTASCSTPVMGSIPYLGTSLDRSPGQGHDTYGPEYGTLSVAAARH
jgi:hypothetical protein